MVVSDGPEPTAAALRKRTENERLLRTAIDTVPAMIAYWDRDLRNLLANEAYVEWFGMGPQQILGRHIREVLGEKIYALNLPHMEAALSGRAQHFDRTIVDASGATRYSQAAYMPDRDGSGRVNGFFVLVSDVTARTEAEMALVPLVKELERRATTDPLTGLANRRELDHRAELALAALDSQPSSPCFIGLLALDLDGFKAVNDQLGHDAGDELLVTVGRRLIDAVRPTDVVARVGGDEFVVLLPDLPEAGAAVRLADRLIDLVREPVTVGAHPRELVQVGVSVGVAVGAAGSLDMSLKWLLREADRRMYLAKKRGGNRRSAPDTHSRAD